VCRPILRSAIKEVAAGRISTAGMLLALRSADAERRQETAIMMNLMLFALGLLTAAYDTLVRV